MTRKPKHHVAVIGAGYAGLGAAYELTCRDIGVTILESSDSIGGLAGSFSFNGQRLEKFYHHWFVSDTVIMDLVAELGQEKKIKVRSSPTGMYYANSLFRLAKPFDLLRFTPLKFVDRIRLGLMVVKARAIKDWMALDAIPAAQWLAEIGGSEVYRVVWEPLLRGKFGPHADRISAAWFWKKIVLRGGSRGKGGNEVLAYFAGGFAALADAIAEAITKKGGTIHLETPVTGLHVIEDNVTAVNTPRGKIACDAVIATPALPITASLLAPHVEKDYLANLKNIQYLANVCLVLQLNRSLSELYWVNVNDPEFPFVGVIEHTNFEPPSSYGGSHIIYLSRYLATEDPIYTMSDQAFLETTLPHLTRMFPDFHQNWILNYSVWRAQYAQPLINCGYLANIPAVNTPLLNFKIATMAQIYPEDRGTNHALRDGRRVASELAEDWANSPRN